MVAVVDANGQHRPVIRLIARSGVALSPYAKKPKPGEDYFVQVITAQFRIAGAPTSAWSKRLVVPVGAGLLPSKQQHYVAHESKQWELFGGITWTWPPMSYHVVFT